MSAVLFIVFVIGLAIGVPIALAMGGAGLLALAIDGNLSLLSVPQRFFDGINSFPLMAVPFFILAADLMTASGITTAPCAPASACAMRRSPVMPVSRSASANVR